MACRGPRRFRPLLRHKEQRGPPEVHSGATGLPAGSAIDVQQSQWRKYSFAVQSIGFDEQDRDSNSHSDSSAVSPALRVFLSTLTSQLGSTFASHSCV